MTTPHDQVVNDVARMLFGEVSSTPTLSEGRFFALPSVVVQHYRTAAERIVVLVAEHERQRIADRLRKTYRSQDGWLWYELGESALEKVAAHIEEDKL